ncbi:TerC family protein [soil metagenome]
MGDGLAIIAMRSASTDAPASAWIIFNLIVVALLALDLFGFNRKAHKIFLREAAWLSAFFIACSLAINAWVWIEWGPDAGLTWFTGYVVEKSLSVDNLFVIAVLFGYFGVPAEYQHRVLFWGIFGAIVMRAFMILLGVALIERFDWVLYIFGAFLIFTGVKLMREHDVAAEPGNNRLLRALRRWIPVSRNYHGQKFFVRIRGHLVATPLFLVLIMIELTDVVFAVDSIPAILGITTDRFIAYTSNIMAVIGLRALYFLVVGIIERVRYLNIGLAVVLIFIGLKMMVEEILHVPTFISLAVIIGVLAASAVASWMVTRREHRLAPFGPPRTPDEDDN